MHCSGIRSSERVHADVAIAAFAEVLSRSGAMIDPRRCEIVWLGRAREFATSPPPIAPSPQRHFARPHAREQRSVER